MSWNIPFTLLNNVRQINILMIHILFFVIKIINIFMNVTTKTHFEVIKHILCYLNGTQDFGMFFEMQDANVL